MADPTSERQSPTADDRLLIERCRAGDRNAQRQLFEQTSPRVYQLLFRITGNADDAADLTQNAFVKALTRIADFDGRSSLATWLHRIAVNEALQFQRRAGVFRRKLGEFAATHTDEFDDTSRRQRSMDVAHALLSLAMPERTVLLLRYQEGYDYRTIAEMTGLPPGTIASRLNRARNQLRGALRDSYGPAEETPAVTHPTIEGECRADGDPLKAWTGRPTTEAP